MNSRRRFWHIVGAGTAFQGGSMAVDSATVMSALVFQLTGSIVAVGAVPTILRLGWLLPQVIVGYLAGRSASSMPFYVVGAFGRTTAIALLAIVLWLGTAAGWPLEVIGAATLGLWILYALLSGIVGVPYNDIVARSIPSELRSRALSIRFLGGGLVAILTAALADRLIRSLEFPTSYAAVLAVAAVLMLFSSFIFVAMGEPEQTEAPETSENFWVYLRDGAAAFREDLVFRRFVFSQWCGGFVLVASPFFIVAAAALGITLENVALLLGAQTAGALAGNPLWGWWGDRRGKLSLLRGIAVARIAPPLTLLGLLLVPISQDLLLPILLAVFFVLGALANGLTIAVIGFLMEVSPESRRPAYSGYFNALTAPAFTLPLIGGFAAATLGTWVVFVAALAAAIGQVAVLSQIDSDNWQVRRS
ncbi:MAG: hypothetical protein JJ911_16815 [Rhizobiaceae bacterium]|nr:hypothetical protein [Rhizobiaceae bacterium]